MKKPLFFAIALLWPLLTLAQPTTDSTCTIKINIGQTQPATKLYLFYQTNGIKYLDSAKYQNGLFVFNLKVSKPLNASIVADHAHLGLQAIMKKRGNEVDYIKFYVHPGTIGMQTNQLLANTQFTGPGINADNQTLQLALKMITSQQQTTSQQLITTRDTLLAKILSRRNDSLQKAKGPIQKTFIQQHPNSYIALTALQEYAGSFPDVKALADLYKQLSPHLRNSALGQEFHAFLTAGKTLAVGSKAPNFTQADRLGKPVSLSAFRGKYVLIDFWASWCGPCRNANPKLVQIYQEFKNRNFTILGISLDEVDGKDKWLQAIKTDRFTWTQLSDLKHWDNEVGKLYSVRYLPQSYLIDPEGIIVGKDLMPKELTTLLQKILPVK
ncbi:redoxin domain-containing protein [Mucilaginibacter terrae]|uniref:redoxin domain-containing protein n=1 Tax=Mucilaginibacter terrae TaxID=1955052 RepID=UPI00363C83DB